MPQVAVQINGKTYRMACDEGQESHLLDLAQRFDGSINRLKGSFGEIGDQRLTVMAGVMVTDELVEAQHKIRGLESELAAFRTGNQNAASQQDATDAEIAGLLDRTASRIESIGAKLGSGDGPAATTTTPPTDRGRPPADTE